MISPQRQSALFLAVVALVALAVSLMLAFASAPPQRTGANGDGALHTAERRSSARARGSTAGATIVAPTAKPPAASTVAGARQPPSLVDQSPSLWTLLAPWALAVDALAVLGMAAVLTLRHGTRRRRRART
jgi:hypothetical protein